MLNTVIDIPVDTVKLDRGFLKNCTMDARGEFLLKKVVGIIQGLGYHVVCEGLRRRNSRGFCGKPAVRRDRVSCSPGR